MIPIYSAATLYFLGYFALLYFVDAFFGGKGPKYFFYIWLKGFY